MKMSDIRVGMKLRAKFSHVPEHGDIEVTELTERGFKYRLLHGAYCLHASSGLMMLANGHEHYGVNGDAQYEELPHEYAI